MGSLRIRPKFSRSLVPSSDNLRRIRSVTSPEGSPSWLISSGTGVEKTDACSPIKGMMTLLFIDRNRSRVYPRPGVMDRHHFVRIPALIVCLLAVWPLAADNAQKTADSAQKLYDEARKAERSGQMARAYLLYSQAAALAPQNELYRLRSQAVEGRAALQSPPKAPVSSGATADHTPPV